MKTIQILAKRKGSRFAYFNTTAQLHWLNDHLALDEALSVLSALSSSHALLKAAVGDRLTVTDGKTTYKFRVGGSAAGLGLIRL